MAEGFSLMDILFGGSRKTEDASNLNAPRTDALYSLLTGGGIQDPTSWMTSGQGNLQNLYGLMGQLYSGANTGATGAQAKSLADEALSEFGTSYMDLARQQSQQAVQNLEGKMGRAGLFSTSSGAVAKALSQGAQEPLLQALTGLGQAKSQAAQNYFNQLLGSQQNALGVGSQLAGQELGMGSNLMGMLSALSEAAWQPAQYEQTGGIAAPLLSVLTGNMGGLGGFLDLFKRRDPFPGSASGGGTDTP